MRRSGRPFSRFRQGQATLTTGRTVERKGRWTRITAAPTPVEARIDRCVHRYTPIIAGVGHGHVGATLGVDPVPALRHLLVAREAKLECPAVDRAAAGVGDG